MSFKNPIHTDGCKHADAEGEREDSPGVVTEADRGVSAGVLPLRLWKSTRRSCNGFAMTSTRSRHLRKDWRRTSSMRMERVNSGTYAALLSLVRWETRVGVGKDHSRPLGTRRYGPGSLSCRVFEADKQCFTKENWRSSCRPIRPS